MNILTGNSSDYCVLGQVQASESDLTQLGNYVGDSVSADEVAIVKLVAFDDQENSNKWKVSDPDRIETLGASLVFDHSESAASAFGVIFAENTEVVEGCNDGKKKRRKVVSAAIPKTPKNADVLADIRLKVAQYVSPAIKVASWEDEKNQVIGTGRLLHAAFVQSPAYGFDNKVLSVAASDTESPVLTGQQQALLKLGEETHKASVIKLVRLQERRQGFGKEVREEKTKEYLEASPSLISEMLLLAESVERPTGTTQKSVAVSEVPPNNNVGSLRKPVNPVFQPQDEFKTPNTQFTLKEI